MCGGVIIADPENPAEAVLAHTRSQRHQAARHGRPTRLCESCRMARIPAWRSLCHFCARSAEAVAA